LVKHAARYQFIFGNPPFSGKQHQNKEQKEDMISIFKGVNASGALDYVTAWYIKAGQYLKNVNNEEENFLPYTQIAFVSTNSITQGEQVAKLWSELFNSYKIKIHFCHRTFK